MEPNRALMMAVMNFGLSAVPFISFFIIIHAGVRLAKKYMTELVPIIPSSLKSSAIRHNMMAIIMDMIMNVFDPVKLLSIYVFIMMLILFKVRTVSSSVGASRTTSSNVEYVLLTSLRENGIRVSFSLSHRVHDMYSSDRSAAAFSLSAVSDECMVCFLSSLKYSTV